MKLLHSPPSETAIVGATSELGALREGITDLVANQAGTLTIAAEADYDPTPYSEHLQRIHIEVTDGPILVKVGTDRDLHISGSPVSLAKFVSFIDVSPGNHTHFEHFPGAEWIHELTTPLVVENHVPKDM